MFLLDTDFLISFLRGDLEAEKSMQALLHSGEVLSVSSISCAELYNGAFRSKMPGVPEQIDSFLSRFEIIDFGILEAKKAGEFMALLLNKGEWVGNFDALNAAIALTHNKKIISMNLKHYSKFKGLKVEKW